MLRFAPALAIAILAGPVAFGVLATLLPAFGYLPAIGEMGFTTQHFADVLNTPGLTQSAMLSLAAGLVTTAISLLLVFLLVGCWYGTPAFERLQHFLSPLLSVPHAAAAFGLAFLIAPSGFVMRALSPWATGFDRPPDWLVLQDPLGLAMMAGLVLKEFPFLLLVTLAAMPQAGARRGGQISTALGYGRLSGFAFVSWPRIYPQIRLAVFAVIAYSSSVVDVAIVLGPSTPSTLAVRLTQWMNDPDLAMRLTASAGAVLQLAICLAAIAIWILGERAGAMLLGSLSRRGIRFAGDSWLRNISLVLPLFAGVTVFAGLGVLALWSVSGFWGFPDAVPRGLSLDTWRRSMPGIGDPLTTTLLAGAVSTLIAFALTLSCLEREFRTGRTGGSRALLFVYLPLIVPQVSFVFGLQLFFLGFGVDASWFALIFTHLVFVLPYVFLSLSNPWRAWDTRYAAISHGLGSSPDATFWRIRLPMLMKPALAAAAVGFAVSIGQYLTTVLVGAGRFPTLTTEAVALASGGDRRVVGVYAFLQMVLPFLGFALATAIPAFLFRHRRDMRAA